MIILQTHHKFTYVSSISSNTA